MDARPTRPDALHRPHPGRLDPARADYEAILTAHRRAVEVGDPGYLDPEAGLFVLTAASLLARGDCCDEGCRHCPWVGAGGEDR